MKKKFESLPKFNPELLTYFQKITEIGMFILRTCYQNKSTVDPWLVKEGVNPYYDKIPFNGGVALRYYYGGPSSFLTPLGKMNISGSGCNGDGDNITKILTERLGLEKSLPEQNDFMGNHGPIYTITKDLDGNALPKADLTNINVFCFGNYDDDIDYEKAEKVWKQVKENLNIKAIQGKVNSIETLKSDSTLFSSNKKQTLPQHFNKQESPRP